MSTITLLKYLGLTLFLLTMSSCFETKLDIANSPFKQSQFSYHGATPRNLGLKFNLRGNSDRLITAVVTLPEYLDFKNQKIQYRWQIDEGVDLVEGQRLGEVAIVTSDKKIAIQIKVANFGIESKKFVRFEASSTIGKNRFFIDGIVSSQSESSFENFVQDIENYKKKENLNEEK